MKTEKSCCFCFGIASEGNIVDSDILDLLKYLIINVDASALENSTVCDGCLNKIVETCQYKTRNSSKMLLEIKNEVDSEKPVTCQQCDKVCEQDTFSLVDCVTQIDWSDFVNYLFVDQDSQSLKSLQICDSCQISVSDIQDFLKLIYVYDQSKMKCEIDNCADIKTTGNKNVVEDKIEIKKEIESFIVDDQTKIGNIIEDDKAKKDDINYINYADFKCKNEEVDLKLEYNSDDSQSTDRYGKIDAGKERPSSDALNNSFRNEEEELGVNSQGCTNRLSYNLISRKVYECDECNYVTVLKKDLMKHIKLHNKIADFKCTFCSKKFSQKRDLHNHLLKVHKSKDLVTSKIHECDECSYSTTKNDDFLRHKLTHGIKVDGLDKYKCQNCSYTTYSKNNLTRHIKMHNDIRDFKCTSCLKKFSQKRDLDDHLLKVHKSKDSVTSKIHECDNCSYSTTKNDDFLRHNLKHGIKVAGFDTYKCQNCIYETYNKNNLNRHIKMHNNIRDFKCTLCSKKFSQRRDLDDHLLKIHRSKDIVISKMHECDKCSYSTTKNDDFLRHKLKHDIELERLDKYKCQNCIYTTYNKTNLIRHIKIHNDIRNFRCVLCVKSFFQRRDLDNHLLKVHKTRDNVTGKIHECDKCSYLTTKNADFLRHKLKHNKNTWA